jgi:hypothetical protein
VVARAGHADGLDEALLTQVPKVARSPISWPIVVVPEITTGDHSKRADGCEGSRFRATQRVLTITVVHDLALASSRQVQVAGKDIAGSVAPLAVGPARIITWIVSLLAAVRLPRIAGTPREIASIVFAIARRDLALPPVVPIPIVVRSTSALAVRAETFVAS